VSKSNLFMRAAAVVAMMAAALAVPSPAQAAGWIGTCYPHRGTGGAGGWCDGNGPDWQYRAVVYCERGGPFYSTGFRWAGDTRGLSAYCRTGTGPSYAGGVEYWYRSELRGHAWA
jgi:hypothetical protein